MMHRDQVGQGEAQIGVAAKIGAGEMVGHNVLTRHVLRPLISAPGATGESGAAVALKRAADDIERNLHPHQREIPTHLNTLPPRFSADLSISPCNPGD